MRVNEFFNSFGMFDVYENQTISIIQRAEIEDTKVLASSRLKIKRMNRSIDALFAKQSMNKVYSVIDGLERISDFSLESLDYDPYVDDSVVMYFANKTIRLNLYVNNLPKGEIEDLEEAYLSFVRNGDSYLVNDTVPNVLNLLNSLLR